MPYVFAEETAVAAGTLALDETYGGFGQPPQTDPMHAHGSSSTPKLKLIKTMSLSGFGEASADDVHNRNVRLVWFGVPAAAAILLFWQHHSILAGLSGGVALLMAMGMRMFSGTPSHWFWETYEKSA